MNKRDYRGLKVLELFGFYRHIIRMFFLDFSYDTGRFVDRIVFKDGGIRCKEMCGFI
jgi:hypothetical protein